MSLLEQFSYSVLDSQGDQVVQGFQTFTPSSSATNVNFNTEFPFSLGEVYTFIFTATSYNYARVLNVVFSDSSEPQFIDVPNLIPDPSVYSDQELNCFEKEYNFTSETAFYDYEPFQPSALDYTCSIPVSNFSYELLGTSEFYNGSAGLYISTFKYNLCAICRDLEFNDIDNGYYISAPKGGDYQNVFAGGLFSTSETITAGRPNEFLAIKPVGQKHIFGYTLAGVVLTGANAKIKVEYLNNDTFTELHVSEEIIAEDLSTSPVDISFTSENSFAVQDLRFSIIDISPTSGAIRLLFSSLDISEDLCVECYALWNSQYEDFGENNCGTLSCPCSCSFSLLPWVDETASCKDDDVNIFDQCT
jgi:hypothetical protein